MEGEILPRMRKEGEVGMTEREQVIAELLYLKHDCLEGSATDQTLDKAIALLKAQEPRVMTLDEVKQERICWIEDADDGMTVRLFPATMFGICEHADGSKSYIFLAQKPGAIDAQNGEWWYLIEDYSETWRCWTSRPDEKRRDETPWE